MGQISMREIARQAGVSAVTVSKALAGKKGVSDAVRQKIIRIARENGYVNPNAQTRSLDVGILTPDSYFDGESFYAKFYKDLVQALTEAGHFALPELLTPEAEDSLQLPNLIRARHVDALILLGQPGKAYLRMIARQQTPVVFLDFYDEYAGADAVVGDNLYGGYRLTSHLIKQGHRDVGFVGTRRATSSIMDRYLGFYRAMISHDLPIREEWVIPDRTGDNRSLYAELPLPENLPTAFVCNCDLVARRLVAQLQQRGLQVPQDISVVGFDDDSAGDELSPQLTTFRVDCQAMARMAVRLVQERCEGLQRPFGRMVVSGQPVYRHSDAPPPNIESEEFHHG